MAVLAKGDKDKKSMLGMIAICSVLLSGIFLVVFLSTNNIKISLDSFSSKNKYRAEAFVKKRKGLLTANVKKSLPTTGIVTGTGLSAEIAFDTTNQEVELSVRDQNNKPVSRVTVFGTVSRVGQKRIDQQFRLREYDKGDFRSAPLNLADGGWILMVSAYDLYTLNKEKLLFHSERAIFLGEQ